jgi:hypothetical protein
MKLVKPIAFLASFVWVVGLSLVIGSAWFIPGTVVAWREVATDFASAAFLIAGVLLVPSLPHWQESWKNHLRTKCL